MKYKIVRYPIEAYARDLQRKNEINKRFNELTKKTKKIKFTDFLKLRSQKPMFAYDDELINYFGKNRGRFISL